MRNSHLNLGYILFALERGELAPNGMVLVDASHREVARRVRKSIGATHKAFNRLRKQGRVRGGGNGPDRQKDKPSGFLLVSRKALRKREHLSSPCPKSPGMGGGVHDCAPTSPRGRHSAPGFRRVYTPHRVQVLDHLERLARFVEESELAGIIGVSRVSDMRRRHLVPLEDAGVIVRSGKSWRLAVEWEERRDELMEQDAELERLHYGGKTRDERQVADDRLKGAAWRNRDNSYPERAPSEDDLTRERHERHGERVRVACGLMLDPESGPGFAWRRDRSMVRYTPDPTEEIAAVIAARVGDPSAWRAWIEPVREALAGLEGALREGGAA